MLEEIETVKELHQEGKLDRKLRIRLIFLSSLTLIFGVIGAYNLVVHDLDLGDVVGTIIVSFVFGMLVMSRMNKIHWDEEREIMTVGRIDAFGAIILFIYIAVRTSTRWILGHFAHNTVLVSSLVIASVFGIMLGRLSSTLISMHKIHKENQ